MKKLLLSLSVLLLSMPSYAQFTRTYTGTLVLTDPTIPGDRLFRDAIPGVCTTTKTYPGVSTGTGVHYNTYTIANTSTTASTCVTVGLTANCTEGTGAILFGSAYTGSFVPANLATNYKSDMGSSPLSGATTSMGITLAPSQVLVLVVSGVTATATCSSYALTVSAPIALPVQVNRPADVALAAYPNPVEDVLHITADKAGSYTLFNATGAAVKQIKGTEVSLRDLPGGVYMLQQNETKVATRIVKL
jgi:hypothetical protein